MEDIKLGEGSIIDMVETMQKASEIAVKITKEIKERPERFETEIQNVQRYKLLWKEFFKTIHTNDMLLKDFCTFCLEKNGKMFTWLIPPSSQGRFIMIEDPKKVKFDGRVVDAIERETKKSEDTINLFEKNVDALIAKIVAFGEEEKNKFRERVTKSSKELSKMAKTWKELQKKKVNDDFAIKQVTTLTPLLTNCADVFEIIFSFLGIQDLFLSVASSCVFFNNIVMKKLKLFVDIPLRKFLGKNDLVNNVANFRVEKLSISVLHSRHGYMQDMNDLGTLKVLRCANMQRLKKLVMPNVYTLRILDVRSLDFYVPVRKSFINGEEGYNFDFVENNEERRAARFDFSFGNNDMNGEVNRSESQKQEETTTNNMDFERSSLTSESPKQEGEGEVSNSKNEDGDISISYNRTNEGEESGSVEVFSFSKDERIDLSHIDQPKEENVLPLERNDAGNTDFGTMEDTSGGFDFNATGGGRRNGNREEVIQRQELMAEKLTLYGKTTMLKIICQCPALETLGIQLFGFSSRNVETLSESCPNLCNFLIKWPESMGGKESKFLSVGFDFGDGFEVGRRGRRGGEEDNRGLMNPIKTLLFILKFFHNRIKRFEINGLQELEKKVVIPHTPMLRVYDLLLTCPNLRVLSIPFYFRSIEFKDEWKNNLCKNLRRFKVKLRDDVFKDLKKVERNSSRKLTKIGIIEKLLKNETKFTDFIKEIKKSPNLQRIEFKIQKMGKIEITTFLEMLQFPNAVLDLNYFSTIDTPERLRRAKERKNPGQPMEPPSTFDQIVRKSVKKFVANEVNLSKVRRKGGIHFCRLTNTLLLSTAKNIMIDTVEVLVSQNGFFKQFSTSLPVFLFSKNYRSLVCSLSRIDPHDNEHFSNSGFKFSSGDQGNEKSTYTENFVKFSEPHIILSKVFLFMLRQLIEANKENLKRILIKEDTSHYFQIDHNSPFSLLQDAMRPDFNSEQLPDDNDFKIFFEALAKNEHLMDLRIDYPFPEGGVDNFQFNRKVREILSKRGKTQKKE